MISAFHNLGRPHGAFFGDMPADCDDYTWTEEAKPAGLAAYDLHTSGERIAELTAKVDELNRAHEQLAAQMRELSVELAALRGGLQ